MTVITGTTSIIAIGIQSNTAWWQVYLIGLTRRIIITFAEVCCHEIGQELSLNLKPNMANHPRIQQVTSSLDEACGIRVRTREGNR